MPAYIHHHDTELLLMICPSCEHLPMFIKDVAPHGGMAKVDFTYECSECGAEMRPEGDQAGTAALDLRTMANATKSEAQVSADSAGRN